MVREDKYIVIKRKDAEKHLDLPDLTHLGLLADKVAAGRDKDGKHPMECVVVECDWPEYEKVWSMIEARVDGEAHHE